MTGGGDLRCPNVVRSGTMGVVSSVGSEGSDSIEGDDTELGDVERDPGEDDVGEVE